MQMRRILTIDVWLRYPSINHAATGFQVYDMFYICSGLSHKSSSLRACPNGCIISKSLLFHLPKSQLDGIAIQVVAGVWIRVLKKRGLETTRSHLLTNYKIL